MSPYQDYGLTAFYLLGVEVLLDLGPKSTIMAPM